MLLDAGADPNLQNPLADAAGGEDPAAVGMLIEAGADIHATNFMGYAPLYIAAESGNVANVQLLIRAGADVNKMEATGMTPLLVAVDRGHMDVAAALIDANADFMVKNASGKTMYNRARTNANRRTLRNIMARKSGQVFTNLQAANNRLPPNVAAHVTEYVTGIPKRNNPAYMAQF
jgi:ankyrin repeat protein